MKGNCPGKRHQTGLQGARRRDIRCDSASFPSEDLCGRACARCPRQVLCRSCRKIPLLAYLCKVSNRDLRARPPQEISVWVRYLFKFSTRNPWAIPQFSSQGFSARRCLDKRSRGKISAQSLWKTSPGKTSIKDIWIRSLFNLFVQVLYSTRDLLARSL
jgi:hypothetical protein